MYVHMCFQNTPFKVIELTYEKYYYHQQLKILELIMFC